MLTSLFVIGAIFVVTIVDRARDGFPSEVVGWIKGVGFIAPNVEDLGAKFGQSRRRVPERVVVNHGSPKKGGSSEKLVG